jgi:hypothetical protein
MSEFTARISLAITGHLRSNSEFDSLLVYPASFERLLTDGSAGYQCTKVYAESGVVIPGGNPVDLEAAGFSSVKVFLLQNNIDPAVDSSGYVSVSGAGTYAWNEKTANVKNGQIDFSTNDFQGWPVSVSSKVIVIDGTVGVTYKLILFGD